MASPHRRATNDDYGRDSRYIQEGMRATRNDVAASKLDGNRLRNEYGATRADDSYDYGFDWIDHTIPKKDYDLNESQTENYGRSNRYRAAKKDPAEQASRNQTGRTIYDNFGAARKEDVGVPGQTRREEIAYSGRNDKYVNDNPYRANELDRPGATRRVPLSEELHSDVDTSDRSYHHGSDLRETHSIEHKVPNYDYIYNRQHGYVPRQTQSRKDSYSNRSWTSMAADRDLMTGWHDMFGKIRTKWTGHSGYDDPTGGISDETNRTNSYDKQPSRRSRMKCKVAIIAALVVVLLAMIAVIVAVLVTASKEDDTVRGTYNFEATVSNLEYTADMADTNSGTFQNYSTAFCDEITQKAKTSNIDDLDLEGCVVNELKNGSVVVSFTIVIVLRNGKTPPSAYVILVRLGIKTDPGTSSKLGRFIVTAVVVIVPFKELNDGDPSPLPTYVAYNTTCGNAMKKRCKTKRSDCIESTCVCATGKMYVAEQDSCNRIVCSEISNISNGNISTNGSTYGSILKVECEDGYEWLSNVETTVCKTPNAWKNIPDCSPVVCEDFVVPDHTTVSTAILTERVFQDKINVSCEEGYIPIGINTVICEENRMWSSPPNCTLVVCEDIDDISNGTLVDMSGNRYMDYAVFECNNGFVMIGESNITCREDGSWESRPQCEQTDCGDLIIPQNAVVNNSKISCDDGYELDGNSQIVCLPSGEWGDLGECLPVSCGTFPTPENAQTDANTSAVFFFGDEIGLSCHDGYVISNNRSVQCNSSGEWDEFPTCIRIKCEIFALPDNMVFANPSEYNRTEPLNFDSTITVSCGDGYDLTGESELRCQSNGNWTELPSCSKVNCSTFNDTISAGRVIHSTGTEYYDNVTIECNDYSNVTVRCLANGTWEIPPICNNMSCEPFEVINGSIHENDGKTAVGDSVEIVCDYGFEIGSDISTIECLGNGTWSANVTCSPVTCGAYETSDNTIKEIEGNDMEHQVESNLTIECKDGLFSTDGTPTTIVTCNATGSWSGRQNCTLHGSVAFGMTNYTFERGEDSVLVCNVTDFTFPQNVTIAKFNETNMPVRLYTITAPGDNATTSTLNGIEFNPVVQDTNISVEVKITSVAVEDCGAYICLVTVFDGDVQLDEKHSITNVEVTGYDKPDITVSSISNRDTNVSCKGYYREEISGDDLYIEAKYQGDGSYNKLENASVLESNFTGCMYVATITHTIQPEILQGNVSLRCSLDYDGMILHSSTIEINDTSDACVDEFVLPVNSHTTSSDIYTIFLACNDGYELDGNDTVICTNGSWSESPTCGLVQCEMLELPDNMVLANPSEYNQTEELLFNSTIIVSCNDGYDLTGESELRCQSNGNWTELPSCSKVNCSTFNDTISAGRVIHSTGTEYNDNVTIECNDYSNVTVRCLANGTWEIPPICNNMSCEPFEVINGSIHGNDGKTAVGDSVEIVCDYGFEIGSDISTIECLGNGTWSANVTCSPVTCGAYETSDNTIKEIEGNDMEHQVESNLTIECKDGLFSTDGTPTTIVTCNATGSWSGRQNCTLHGSVAFGMTNYTFERGEDSVLVCNVTDFTFPQNVTIAKFNETNMPVRLYTITAPGDNATTSTLNGIEFNPVVQDTNISVEVKITSVAVEDCGAYICLVTVFDGDVQLDEKHSITNVEVTGYDKPDITVSSISNRDTNVSCKGYYREEISGDDLYIEAKYQGDGSYNKLENASVLESNFTGCMYVATITHTIQPEILQGNVSLRCSLDYDGMILHSSTIEINDTSDACVDEFVLPVNSHPTSSDIYTIFLACNDGYELDGNDTVICKNGSWSESPTCGLVQCEMLELPDNMVLANPSEYNQTEELLFNSTIIVSCNDGYDLTGESELRCQSNGNWTELPSCSKVNCSTFNDTISAGRVIHSTGTEYNDNVTIECNDYSNVTVRCLANGTWEIPPICNNMSCEPFEVINGSIHGNDGKTAVGDSVEIVCDYGFEIGSDISTIECLGNGTWSANVTCSPVTCGAYETSDNTIKEIEGNDMEHQVESNLTIECKDGLFSTDGTPTTIVTCNATGSWSGRQNCTLHGSVAFGMTNYTFERGEDSVLVCNVTDFTFPQNVTIAKFNETNMPVRLYTITAPGDNATTSTLNGIEFNPVVQDTNISVEVKITSVAVEDCGAYICLVTVFDGDVQLDEKHSITNVEVTGYDKPDITVSSISNRDTNVSCKGYYREEISGDDLYIEAKYQGDDSYNKLENASVLESNFTGCMYVATITHTIQPEILQGNVSLRCSLDYDGMILHSSTIEINDTSDACVDEFVLPVNSHTTSSSMYTIFLACNDGYELDGNDTVICTNGSWSESPTCGLVQCEMLELPDNMVLANPTEYNQTEELQFNSTITVSCDDGYDLTGESELRCQSNGNWTELPSCSKVNCSTFNDTISAGRVIHSTGTEYNDNVTIECNDYSNVTVRCLANGTWEIPPICNNMSCEPLEVNNGSIEENDGAIEFSVGASVEILCYEGFEIKNGTSPSAECMENGTWSHNATCSEITCVAFSTTDDTITGNNMTETKYPFGSNYTIKCVDGLTFSDESIYTIVTCDATDMWSSVESCIIPGYVEFDSSNYSLKKGEAGSISFTATKYKNTQQIIFAKDSATGQQILLYLFQTSTDGTVSVATHSSEIQVNYKMQGDAVVLDIEFTSVGNNTCGTYACAILVNDDNGTIVSKFNMTNITVADVSSPIIAVSSPSVEVGEQLVVDCSGYIDRDMSDDELYLEVQYQANTSFRNNTSPSKSAFEILGCTFITTKTYAIPTENVTDSLVVRCGLNSDDVILTSNDIEVNVTLGAYAEFSNESYVVFVGEENAIECDFYGEDVEYVIIYDTNKTNMINITDYDTKEEIGTLTLNADKTFLGDMHTRVVADLGLLDWCSNGGVIGEDTYTCKIIYDGGKTRSTDTTVKVTKLGGVPDFQTSVEIVEGKDTTAEKLFWVRGELGNPPGSLEVDILVNNEYVTFLSLADGMNDTESAWVVNSTSEISECGVEQTITFALKAVSMSMHLTSMRGVIRPPDNTSNTQVSESKVIKVVKETVCRGYEKYTTIQHPFYCHSAVTCYADGTVEGVPPKCADDQCFDNSTIQCTDDCASVGCMFEPIVCDRTSISTLEGTSVQFKCNTQDIGESVTDVSVNGANIHVSEQLPDDQAITDNVNLTITEEHFILSVVNVSCDNDKDYAVIVNEKWNTTLELGVESEPGLPSIELPEAPNANEEMIIVCNGSVGRDGDGHQRASIYLEVADEDVENAYLIYDNTDDVEKESIETDCTFIETVTHNIIPGSDWNGTYVRCTTKDDSMVYETTSGHLITLGLPNVYCNPVTAMKLLEDAAVFECELQDITDITTIEVQRADNGNNIQVVINATINDLPWTNDDDTLSVSVPSVDSLTLGFDNISCVHEGDYTVNINDASTAVMSLRIVSAPSVPTLYVQSNASVNQHLQINCTAELGRDNKGLNRSELFLELQFEDESEFSVYTESVESSSTDSNCKHVGVLDLSFYPDGSWNNSLIRCVTRDGNNTYNVSAEETLVLKPSAVYFENESGIGTVDENYTMICIVDGMSGLTDIVINKGDSTDDMKDKENVYVINKDISSDVANLTIVITVKCGDDGVYYCRPKGTIVTSQAEMFLSVQWKPGTPVINLSYDIVEDAPLWAGYETVCSAEIGYNNASIFIQTNKNGVFENLTQTVNQNYPIVEYKPSECSNVHSIAFARSYSAEWNETIFRCVVKDADYTFMDAEVIYVVPESICDNKTSGTTVMNTFDCRSRFTCTDSETKKLQPFRFCAGADECYHDGVCVDCEDAGKCREDPLDINPYMDCTKTEAKIGGTASIDCSVYHITIDDASATDITLSNSGTSFIDTTADTSSGDASEATYTSSINGAVSLVVGTSSIKAEFNPVICIHEGQYVMVYDNGTSEIEAVIELDVHSSASAPTISTSSDSFYRGVEMTVACNGPVGKPEGSLELMFRRSSSDSFESSPFTEEDSNYDADNCSFISGVNYTFVVSDDIEGFEYQCKSVGEDGAEYVSSIKEVILENSDIYFTDGTVRAEIGGVIQSTCVLSGGSGASGATISLTQSNGTSIELCQVDSSGTGTCDQPGYNVTVQDDGDNRTVVVSATAACQHEGTLYCYSPDNSQLKTSSQIVITRQGNTPDLTLPIAFEGKQISQDSLYCSADVGYPSTNRVLKIQNRTNSNAHFKDFVEFQASEQCEINETKVSKSSFAFQLSDDQSEFRCIVFDTVENETIDESITTTLDVYANECPTDTDEYIYLPHPVDCHQYLWCYSEGTLAVQTCPGGGCFNTSSITTVNCLPDSTLCPSCSP